MVKRPRQEVARHGRRIAVRGDRFGTHRVVSPKGTLPQAAWQLDNDLDKRFDDEVLLEVDRLNVDSASFVQMEGEAGAAADEPARAATVARRIGEIVSQRGKQHNPVTGSGGMLLGRVLAVGPGLAGTVHTALRPGDRVATLVSLTLTPLQLEEIGAVDCARHQVAVKGRAVLFESGAWAKIPADLPEGVALAALDVAGAAPQVARLCRQLRQGAAGPVVAILGCGGKSGLLCSAAARRAGAVRVVGVERSAAAAAGAHRLGACHEILVADAADAVALSAAVVRAAGQEVDLMVSCVNVPDAEMGAILATRDGGTIYFFSMATHFAKAALGAEGVSRDVSMLVGNGYCPGHAEATIELLRTEPTLRQIFIERFG
jgi:L-erythro-3,5-diaminohexanoate dehydrogenase